MTNVKTGLDILPVEENLDLITQVNHMAQTIYLRHYAGCINPICAKKMYNTYQTPKAIKSAISKGEKYFIIRILNKNVGYFAIKVDEKKTRLFLSKIYLHPIVRGQGIGKYILNLLTELSKELGVSCIELFVSKTNPTVKIYEQFGFEIIKEVFSDLEDGIVENDYFMRLKI